MRIAVPFVASTVGNETLKIYTVTGALGHYAPIKRKTRPRKGNSKRKGHVTEDYMRHAIVHTHYVKMISLGTRIYHEFGWCVRATEISQLPG